MQKIYEQTVGDVLRQTLQECNMTGKLDEQRAIGLWRTVVGDELADRCGRPWVENGLMTVHVSAAPLRQELNMCRSRLIKHINDALGKTVIHEMRFN